MIIMCIASFSFMPLSFILPYSSVLLVLRRVDSHIYPHYIRGTFMNFMESWNPCAMAARMFAMPTPASRLASASASEASRRTLGGQGLGLQGPPKP